MNRNETITIVPAITRTLYPALVAYQSEPKRLAEAYRLATLLVLALEAPVAAFLLVTVIEKSVIRWQVET